MLLILDADTIDKLWELMSMVVNDISQSYNESTKKKALL